MLINRQRRVPVATRPLAGFLGRVRSALRLGDRDLTVCLVSDASIARLNQSFRGEPGPTDVLSFPANGHPAPKCLRRSSSSTSFTSSPSYLGDIAISPETARRNAARFGRTLPQELRVLVLHGVLHLLGYDHETDRGRMDRVERRLRAQLGLR
jgi:probable rRNA maturation factor